MSYERHPHLYFLVLVQGLMLRAMKESFCLTVGVWIEEWESCQRGEKSES